MKIGRGNEERRERIRERKRQKERKVNGTVNGGLQLLFSFYVLTATSTIG